jgi:amino-acid N-acetyltransferase
MTDAPDAGPVAIEAAGPARLADIQALLREAELPADVEPHLDDFILARRGETVVGCVGMEVLGGVALFRSLAVARAERRRGLAHRLYGALEEAARGRGVERAFLLTRTIQPLAERWGFRTVPRSAVPEDVLGTSEFRGACCAGAVAMVKEL